MTTYKKLIFYALAISALMACTEDGTQKWLYGDKQELSGSEWLHVMDNPPTSSKGVLTPTPVSDERTLRFGEKDFTLITKERIYDEERHAEKDTIITRHGIYIYEHPKIYMTMDEGFTVDAWISPLNRICFYDEAVLLEFKRK